MSSSLILDSTNNTSMNEDRTIVKGFHNRMKEEKDEETLEQEENFIPLPQEEQNPVNITWIIWAFAVVLALIFCISVTSLCFDIAINKKLNKIEYEQGRNRDNTSECSQSIYISRTSDGVWEIQDCSR